MKKGGLSLTKLFDNPPKGILHNRLHYRLETNETCYYAFLCDINGYRLSIVLNTKLHAVEVTTTYGNAPFRCTAGTSVRFDRPFAELLFKIFHNNYLQIDCYI